MKTTDIVYENNSVYFTADGHECLLQFSDPHGWRLRTAVDGKFDDFGAGQTLARDLDETPATSFSALACNEAKNEYTAPDGSRAEFEPEKGLHFYTPSGASAHNIDSIFVDSDGKLHLGGDLECDECLYGTGERFDEVNQRGKLVEIYSLDIWMEWRGNSYVPIPIITSSRGCGLFMNRFERQVFDLGCSAPDRFDIEVDSESADLYIFATDNISDVLYGYSLISGFAPVPADWLYGTQVCRYSPDFSTPQGVYDMVHNMEANDFPWEAVIIEGFDAFNKSKWDALKEISDFVHSKGKKLMLYHFCGGINNTIDAGFGTRDEYMVHTADGDVDIPDAGSYNPADNPKHGSNRYVDITSPEAMKWWFEDFWGSLTENFGIDGSKIDFCELMAEYKPLVFSDGRKSNGSHHWYPVLYNTLMYKYFSQRPEGGMNLSRGGGIGAQRYPFLWAGDQRREFHYLACVLKACLSSGLSGIPFMSFDMSGYRPATDENSSNPEAEVFVRGLEYTCFSANIQTHGKVMRPYDFDDATKNLYRIYSYMHDAMRPYLVEFGRIASETAMPLMRALVLYDQSDSICANTWDEYMLGDAFLVAPVLKQATSRSIYLPEGTWKDIYTGEVYSGAQTLPCCNVPLEKVPVFVNTSSKSATLDSTLTAMAPYIAEINALCK